MADKKSTPKATKHVTTNVDPVTDPGVNNLVSNKLPSLND